MDGGQLSLTRDKTSLGFPVRGDHQNRTRSNAGNELLPALREAILAYGVHRRAMGEKGDGHAG